MMEYHGRRLQLRLEGESHSPEMRVTIWGLRWESPWIRKPCWDCWPGVGRDQSPLTTGRNEKDEPEFLSGARDGMLTGEPVVIRFANEDRRPEDYAAIRTIPPAGPCRLSPVFTGRSHPPAGAARWAAG